MPGGFLRSALVVSWGEASASQLEPSVQPTLELARLLGDRNIGGFDVSVMASADAPALQLELIRFLADRAPEDTVVVHLAGNLALDEAAEVHLGGGAQTTEWRHDQALPLSMVQAELDRCRSQQIVIVVDCPTLRPAPSASPTTPEAGLALEARLGGPGRSVHVVSTATVIDALLGTRSSGPFEAADALRRALLVPSPDGQPAHRSAGPLLVGLAALVAVLVAVCTLVIVTLGIPGLLLSALVVPAVAWPLVALGVQEWRRLPDDDIVLGEGVPFYELYMLRRSKKSKKHFGDAGMR